MVHPTSIASFNWGKNDQIQTRLRRDLQTDQRAAQPHHVGGMCQFTFRLPAIMNVNPAMRVAMAEFLTDRPIQRTLEDARLLNWCLQTVKLTAVQTTGDGNCLLHAAAMYMWGVQDTECILRQQLYNAIRSDPRGELRERWERQRRMRNASYPGGGLQYTQEQWAREWQLMVSMATPEPANPVSGQHFFRSLEEFHVFTLANVLRRPIIIIADVEGHSLTPVHFGGIYLPLLRQPQHCVRYPVVLAFHNQHFTPLIAEKAAPAPNSPASPPAQQQAIPLTGQNRQLLQVQYLQSNEENRVMVLLRQYLHIEDVPLGDNGQVPAALINGPSVPPELNFITDLLQYDWSGQGAGGAGEAGAPQAEATGSQCSQGAEGLSVSGQHQDQSLLADKLQQIGLANSPPNPSPAPSNPHDSSANAIDAERLVVPTPGGTMGSQGGVSQQQNGSPSAGPLPDNRQTYAAAVTANLKTPQTTTPKRRPGFPLVDKTSSRKEKRCLTEGCPNTPIPSLGGLCKKCRAQKDAQKRREQFRNRNLSSAPGGRKNQRSPSGAGERSVSAPANSPSMTRKMPPVGANGSINSANQHPGPGDSSIPLEIQLRGPEMQQLYSQACHHGAQPVYSVRGLVVGQFRSGKTCVIRRLTGERAVENEPITDGIEISPSVKTKTWQKAREETDEFKETMAEHLAEQQERIKSRTWTSLGTQETVSQQGDRKNATGRGEGIRRTTSPQTAQQQNQVDMMVHLHTHDIPDVVIMKAEQQLQDDMTVLQQTQDIPDDVLMTAEQQLQGDLTVLQQTQDIPDDVFMKAKQQLQDDMTVLQQTQDIPDDVLMTAEQQLQGDLTVLQQIQDIPDDVIMKAKERLQSGVTEEQLGTAEHPRLSFWDFGGQATYYGSHQCFFTYRGIYILVMSLLQKLSDPVPDLDYKAAADNLITGRDYLDHWLNSVRTHTLVPGHEETGEPHVVLVLTHKDKVSESDIEKYKKDILDHISGKAAGNHVSPKIFVIDNFNEDNSDIDELREYLREVAKGLWFMGQEVPMTWLHLKSKLMDKRTSGDPFCHFHDVVDLARSDDVGIMDDSHDVADILTFLHDLGDIIFINEPILRDHVALRPQVMIDVFKTIITVPEYQQDRSMDGEVAEMWRRLENKGILSDRLLTIVWTKADQKMQKPFLLRHKPFLKRLMEKYYLLCNATPIGEFCDTVDKPEKEEIYFVPSLLAAKPDDSTLYPGHMRRYRHPLYVEFDNMFLPSGMFYRLQAICVRRFGLEESHVFAGCGRFPTNDVKQQFVVTKVKHYLKVELLSAEAEDQTEFKQGLPVRKFLSSCLFEIKEKWIPSIQYDWCFAEESDEESGKPVFHPLSDITHEMAMGSSRFPGDFIDVWMGRSSDKRMPGAENSGGSGPAMIEPTLTPGAVHTIGPVLDCMETYGALSLAECDRIRHELTFVSRFKELVATVNRAGDMCHRLLGASVEVCLPERAPMFPREERGSEIVVIHAGDYNDKLVQPLLKQLVQSSSRYGVTVSEDVVKPGDIITEKLLDHLLQRNVRMVVPIITPQTLHSRHWSMLGYEFCAHNKDLVFPVIAYPEGTREHLLDMLGRRCARILDMPSKEVPMTEEPPSTTKISLTTAEILRKASSSVVLHTYKITAEGCTVEEDGVAILFPKGCVKTERSLSLEVEMLPIDDALTKAFSAVTPVLTVHQDMEEEFLEPVRVTLPWAWKKSDCGTDKTVLMKRKSHQWSLLRAEFKETVDAVSFTTRHFCGMACAKESGNGEESPTSTPENQDGTGDQEAAEESNSRESANEDEAADHKAADESITREPNIPSASKTTFPTKAYQACWNRYTEDKVYLIINPNQATTDNNYIHLMCVHKEDDPTDFFRAANMWPLPPFQQRIVMGREEMIDAKFDERKEVIGDPLDVSDGILFFFPPADCNRWSVGLILHSGCPAKKMYQGAVHFRRLSESGVQVTDLKRRIPSAPVFLYSDKDETATDQQIDGTRISMTLSELLKARPMKGGSTKSHTCHVGQPSDIDPSIQQAVTSVLLVIDEYGTSHGGSTSATNRQVAQFLKHHGVTVHATTVQASEDDKQCAAEDGVILHLPVQIARKKTVPCLEWLTNYHSLHYPDIPNDLKCIVGHVDVTSEAAKRIQEHRCQHAKLVLFNHDIPEDTEHYKGTKKAMAAGEKVADILKDAKNADAVFSLGRRIYDYFETKYKSLGECKPCQHFLFRPRPSPVFEAISVRPGGGEKVVLSVGRVTEVDKLKGHDLAAWALGEVAEKIPNVRLDVCGIDEDDWEASKEILEKNLHSGKIKPTLLPSITQEDIAQKMQQAHLVLMPSRAEPFGLIGLEAIAAGIPVLISDKSGLADMIINLIEEGKCHPDMRHRIVETSVNENDLGVAAKEWAKKIMDTLKYSESEFENAAKFKKMLLDSMYWEESLQNLLRVCGLID